MDIFRVANPQNDVRARRKIFLKVLENLLTYTVLPYIIEP
nr:MAG TPA: hypothetical protein [Caudoviricetes sp.]